MFNDSYWKSRSLDWVQVSQVLQEEEEALGKWRPMTERPETPLIMDIINAAGKFGIPPPELKWEIHTYARSIYLLIAKLTSYKYMQLV